MCPLQAHLPVVDHLGGEAVDVPAPGNLAADGCRQRVDPCVGRQIFRDEGHGVVVGRVVVGYVDVGIRSRRIAQPTRYLLAVAVDAPCSVFAAAVTLIDLPAEGDRLLPHVGNG